MDNLQNKPPDLSASARNRAFAEYLRSRGYFAMEVSTPGSEEIIYLLAAAQAPSFEVLKETAEILTNR